MSFRIPPKIAVINSLAGYGRCSTTEALPIISAMRVQACPVPTSVFSNHTGFSTHFGVDFTDYMAGYLQQWDSLGLVFDGIYCGFLGKKEQLPLVASFLKSQRQKGCSTILVDPVMGDHGKAYKTITPEHCRALKELVSLADIITPNITEACLLTDTPYQESGWQKPQLHALCAALHAMGPKKIAVTGLRCQAARNPGAGQDGCFLDPGSEPEDGFLDPGAGQDGCFLNSGLEPEDGFLNPGAEQDSCFLNPGSEPEDGFLNLISKQEEGSRSFTVSRILTPSAGPSRHGTGDIFASILAADAVNGTDFLTSVQKATDFISACIRVSEELHIPEQDGVCFENLLHTLS